MLNANGIYTLRQVCELTSLSKSTIFRLRKDGKFVAAVRLTNGRIGFPIAEIHRWLAARPAEQPERRARNRDGQ
ncbi:helix-turn-helix transcriptional regulator [Rhizobium sp. HT1-10]|uniref:helix-turn-helix transcriptional regulator n=1 Tax=Rhizobium sp. HT1-10 TaxID=3111638 RepID=UPI003C2C5E79